MGGMSVSWRHAARVAATAAAAVLALILAPGLLRTPEPPPLDPEIGLTGLAEAEPVPVPVHRDQRPERVERAERPERAERKVDRSERDRERDRPEPKRKRAEPAPPGASGPAARAGAGSCAGNSADSHRRSRANLRTAAARTAGPLPFLVRPASRNPAVRPLTAAAGSDIDISLLSRGFCRVHRSPSAPHPNGSAILRPQAAKSHDRFVDRADEAQPACLALMSAS